MPPPTSPNFQQDPPQQNGAAAVSPDPSADDPRLPVIDRLQALGRADEESNGNCSPDSGVNDMIEPNPERQEPPVAGQPYEVMVYLAEGETLNLKTPSGVAQPIVGPATVRMVSPNGPPGAIPMAAPHGHMVRQVVDENGHMTHILMGAQPPAHFYPSMNGGPARGSHPSGNGVQYGPRLPQGFNNHFHHHVGATGVRMVVGNTGQPTNQSNNPGYPQQQQKMSRARVGIRDRPRGPQPSQIYNNNLPAHSPHNVTCGSPRSGGSTHDRSLDYSCSSSTDSHDTSVTSEDEKRGVFLEALSALSAIPLPKVEVGSHRATVYITAPLLSDAMLSASNVNSDLQFQLQYSQKAEGPYSVLYRGDATEIKMQDLEPGTQYYVKVSAILDDIVGKNTEPVMFETEATVPNQPKPPNFFGVSKSSMSLRWSPSNSNGSKIIKYVLEWSQGASQKWENCYTGKDREHIIKKLQHHTRYTFRLAAVNGVGQSEWSLETHEWTLGSVPPIPDPPHCSEATPYSLLLTWIKRPQIDREFTLQQEEENSEIGFLPVYNGSEVSFKLSQLQNSTSYRFKLRSSNAHGTSPWSRIVTYQTKAVVPSPPLHVRVKGHPSAHSIRITWECSLDNGGSPIVAYHAQLDVPGKGFQPVYQGRETECSCGTALIPGTNYRARVAAANNVGQSGWSNIVCVATQPVCPGPCVRPQLVTKPRAHSMHIKWAQPDWTGGSPISGYLVEIISMDNITREAYRGPNLDCVVAGLSPGSMYLIQVRGINSAGSGQPSEPLQVASGAGVPESPSAPTVSATSPHSVAASWNMPLPNGAQIIEYRLECRKPNTNQFTQVYAGLDLHYELQSLTPVSEYGFRVAAVNSAGVSEFSPSVSCVTPPAAPGAVSHVRASPEGPHAVTVTWREPQSNGSTITEYKLDYNGNNEIISVNPELLSYTIENLQPNTTYRIRVHAVNTVGSGPIGAPYKVTTPDLPPAPPTLECQTLSSNSLRLKWREDPATDTYTVKMCRGKAANYNVVYSGSVTQCKVNKLTEDTEYQFTISSLNSLGQGPSSTPLVLRTTWSPPHSVKNVRVTDVQPTRCRVSWTEGKGHSLTDRIESRIFLSTSQHHSFKQVYRGSEASHVLSGLSPDTTYSIKLSFVRICDKAFSGDTPQEIEGPSTSPQETEGPSTSPLTFTTPSVEPEVVRQPEPLPPSQLQVMKNRVCRFLRSIQPEEERRNAMLYLMLLFIVSITLAVILQRWCM